MPPTTPLLTHLVMHFSFTDELAYGVVRFIMKGEIKNSPHIIRMKSSHHEVTTKVRKGSGKSYPFIPRPSRTLEWLGGVNYQNLEKILCEIKRFMVESPLEEIHLMVNSYGGTSSVGMSFYDAATSWLKPNLVTIGSGDVDSSGIIVFLSGKKRYITKNTTLLFHLAGGTFSSEKRYTVEDMQAILNEYHLKDFQYACIISDATGGRYTPGMILDIMSKNTIITAPEAVEMGLAHKII